MGKIWLGIAFLVIAGCGKGASKHSSNSDDGTNSCNPEFESSFFNCNSLVSIDSLDDPNDDYIYRDSYSDPSFPSHRNADQYRTPVRFLDLFEIAPNTRVAPNFVLSEFISLRKGRYGIISPVLIDKLQAIRDQIQAPIKVNSGYRSPGYNARTPGSAKWSRHMYGDAVDMWSPAISLGEMQEQCLDQESSFTLLYETHIHCDWRNDFLSFLFFDNPPNGPSWDLSSELPLAYLKTTSSEVQINETVQLVGQIEPALEEGRIVTLWEVETEDGSWTEFESHEIQIHWETPGLYRVRGLVGGTLPAEIQIRVR